MIFSSIAPGWGHPVHLVGALALAIGLSAAPSAGAQMVERPAGTERAGQAQAREIARVRDLLARNRPRDAAAAAEDALARFQGNVQLRFLLGVAQTDAGRPEAAIATFEALVREHPELAEPYNNLAVLHASGGRLGAARDALEQAVRAVPDYGLAYENLGDVYVRMAQEAYERATQVAKPSTGARRKLTAVRELSERITGQ